MANTKSTSSMKQATLDAFLKKSPMSTEPDSLQGRLTKGESTEPMTVQQSVHVLDGSYSQSVSSPHYAALSALDTAFLSVADADAYRYKLTNMLQALLWCLPRETLQ